MRGRLGEAWACLGRLWGGLRGLGGRLLQDMTREMSVTCETTLQALWQFRMVGALLDLLSSSLPPNSPPCAPHTFLSWMPLGHAWGMPLLQGHEPLPCPHAQCARACTECRIPHVASRGARISSLHALSFALWPPWPCPWPVSIWQPLDPLPHQPWTSTGPDTSPGPPPPALGHRHQPWTTPVPAVVLTP